MPTTSDQELPGELELRAMLDREPGRVHCDGVRVQAMAREVLRLRSEHANHLSVEQILEEGRKGWEERALNAEKVAADLRAEVGLLRTDNQQLRASLRQHEEAEAIRAKALGEPTCAHPAFTKEPNFGGVSMLPSPEFVTVLSPPEASKAAETQAKPAETAKGDGLTLHIRLTDELREAIKQLDLASVIRDEATKVRADIANLYRRFFGEAR